MSRYKTNEVCRTFGIFARVISSTSNYTNIVDFQGLIMPLIPHQGLQELNEFLRERTTDRVALIDGRHYPDAAVFGKDELASAMAGKCRAVIVLGNITQVAALEQARIPIRAYGAVSRPLPADIGSAVGGYIDCEAGLISSEHYLVADADGVVAVEQALYQSRFPLK